MWVSENGWAREGAATVGFCGWRTQEHVPEDLCEPPRILGLCICGHGVGEIFPDDGKGWVGREEVGPDLL